MVKYILIPWFIFSIFALLYFVFETWRYLVYELEIWANPFHFLSTVSKQLMKQFRWKFILFVLMGPFAVIVAVRGVEAAKKQIHDQEN